MPTYDYICATCKHESTQILNMSDRKVPCDAPCESCRRVGNVSMIIGPPRIVSGVGSILSKTNGDWKSRLTAMKKAYPGSTIHD